MRSASKSLGLPSGSPQPLRICSCRDVTSFWDDPTVKKQLADGSRCAQVDTHAHEGNAIHLQDMQWVCYSTVCTAQALCPRCKKCSTCLRKMCDTHRSLGPGSAWSVISSASSCLLKPTFPVAQKAHWKLQPTLTRKSGTII